jgi:hypothetical protein
MEFAELAKFCANESFSSTFLEAAELQRVYVWFPQKQEPKQSNCFPTVIKNTPPPACNAIDQIHHYICHGLRRHPFYSLSSSSVFGKEKKGELSD